MLRLVVFLALFAAVVYGFFWLLEQRRGKGGGGKARLQPIPRRPVGPDDDEDFLRELERRRRHSKDGPKKNDRKDAPQKDVSKNEPPQQDQPKDGLPDGLPDGATPDVPAKDEES